VGGFARIDQLLGYNVGYTSGDNGVDSVKGYSAGRGWSPVAVWGNPDGTKLLEWLREHPNRQMEAKWRGYRMRMNSGIENDCICAAPRLGWRGRDPRILRRTVRAAASSSRYVARSRGAGPDQYRRLIVLLIVAFV
jgi:hypothetical protein